MQQSLKYLGPGNFAIVMGLCGLGLAWARARATMGEGALWTASAIAAGA